MQYELKQTNLGWEYSFWAGEDMGRVIGGRPTRSEAEQAARADIALARMFTYYEPSRD